MKATFNKTPVIINDIPYTRIEDCLHVLKDKGFCFVKNAVNIDFNFKKYINPELSEFKIVEEFSTRSIEYDNITSQIFKSKLLEEFHKNNHVYCSNIDLRCSKSYSGTFLHKDSDIFYDRVFDFDVFTCWTPLLDTTFNSGVVAIVDRFVDEGLRRNSIRRKILFFGKSGVHSKSVKEISAGFRSDEEIFLKEKDEWGKYGERFYAKELKVNDVALFSKETLHGALDTNIDIRSSLDFRLAIIPKDKKNILDYILAN